LADGSVTASDVYMLHSLSIGGRTGVTKGGQVSDSALVPDSAARIVKQYAARVGLDPAGYAGHSLRSGFLTSAAESGASIWKLSEVSRHKSLDTLRGYVRRVDLFKEHAGAGFL
jgi:hypothetical protein